MWRKVGEIMRYKITIQYDGTAYHGWQRQPAGVKTVQAELEAALEIIVGKFTLIEGSGRTDEGVHALGQVAHFDSDKQLACEKYVSAMNFYLPKDIRVVDCKQVADNFHARKSTKRKTYKYRIYDDSVGCPLYNNRVQFYLGKERLDEVAMNEGIAYLVGRHDFSAFMSAGSSAKTFTRTIFDASVSRDGKIIEISITGDGFLYNMVRIIVGILIKIGSGQPVEAMREILLSQKRKAEWAMAYPQGLYLYSVEYGES